MTHHDHGTLVRVPAVLSMTRHEQMLDERLNGTAVDRCLHAMRPI